MPKKILIISECFYPEEFKINEVAVEWKNQGFDVDVLTMVPSYPASEVYAGYKNKLFQKEIWNGIDIYRIKTIAGYKTSLFKKFLKYLVFMAAGSIVSLKIGKKYDYIFGFNVGPLTAMVPGVVLQQFYKKPVTLWVQDIWPDSVYAYGFKKSKVLEFFLSRFVRYVYRHTSSFAISTKGFKEKITPYLEEEKEIIYAPNWADFLNKELEPFSFSEDDKVHFTFAGNVGTVQNLEKIIKAFGALDGEYLKKTQLNIIGDGSYLEELRRIVKENNFKNIIFWGKKSRDEIFRYLEASDFLIVSLADKPIFSLTVPAKTQTYIAAKKPIIGIVKGETAKIIEENNLGFCCDPSNIEEIRQVFIKAISLENNKIEKFTKNCDNLTNIVFNKKYIINSLLEVTRRGE